MEPTIDLDQISFAEWLVDLNKEAALAGYRGRPLVEQTGQMQWLPFYESRTPPAEALKSAELDAKAFGNDYCD
jgi:hypothetical protein